MDAIDRTVSSVLLQAGHSIIYLSRRMTAAEKNYYYYYYIEKSGIDHRLYIVETIQLILHQTFQFGAITLFSTSDAYLTSYVNIKDKWLQHISFPQSKPQHNSFLAFD